MFTVGIVVEQAIVDPDGPITVHNIDPAGSGFAEEVPATSEVRIVVPPRIGELDAESEIVGTSVEMPIVTKLDEAAE